MKYNLYTTFYMNKTLNLVYYKIFQAYKYVKNIWNGNQYKFIN
jgi:hypothetical protein